MQDSVVSYYFEGEGFATRAFEISAERPMVPRKGTAPWTRLNHSRCKNCPLSSETFSYCPAAVDIEVVIDSFNEVLAQKELTVTVIFSDGRETKKTVPSAVALSGLLGMIFASSPCPILSRMKGMARLHSPFSTPAELMVRFVGTYLIGQYTDSRNGGSPEWSLEGLKTFLTEIEQVNRGLIARLESAGGNQESLEGIKLLMVQSSGLKDAIDSWDEQLEGYGLPALHGV